MSWRVKPIFQRDPMYADYAERMAKEMRATIPPLPKKIGQEPSTQRIIDRPESEDEAWRNRPLPTWEQAGAVPWTKDPYDMSDAERDSLVGKRELTPDEVQVIRRLQERGRGHTFGDAVSEGATGSSSDSKEKATQAFMYSPGTSYEGLSVQDKERIRSLTQRDKLSAPEATDQPQFEAERFKEGINPRRFIPKWLWELLGRQW